LDHGEAVKPPATVKDPPTYERGRMGISITGDVLFFPKVRILKNGLRRRTGKALVINEPFDAFLNAALHLAGRAGVKLKVSIHYPKPRKAGKRRRK
jgi:hypothetical protein